MSNSSESSEQSNQDQKLNDKDSSISSSKKTAVKTVPSARGKKRKHKQVVSIGHVYIHASFNNTIVSITDTRGNVIAWSTAGSCFRGARKGTPFAAGAAARKAAIKAREMGVKIIEEVCVNGPGVGRETAIRTMGEIFEEIFYIRDATSIPHNGCRARKKRRV